MRSKMIISLGLLACTVLVASIIPTESGKVDKPVEASITAQTLILEIRAPIREPVPICPITETEITMLAQTIYAEANVLHWYGERHGMSYQARQAAVAWVALNRLDAGEYGATLAEVLSLPAQFAYSPDIPVTDEMTALARDVVDRWWAEKQGEADVGRTIPPDYLYFDGDGMENYFRKEYRRDSMEWAWNLPDPYQGSATWLNMDERGGGN